MHLGSYTVNGLSIVFDVIYEVYQSCKLTWVCLQIVIINIELNVGSCILACIFKCFHGIFLTDVVSPIEVIVCPVQVQTVFFVFYRCSVRRVLTITHEVTVYATPLIVVRNRFVDDIPFFYAFHSLMLQHTFNPCFHCTQ